jgi:hypothetical protein
MAEIRNLTDAETFTEDMAAGFGARVGSLEYWSAKAGAWRGLYVMIWAKHQALSTEGKRRRDLARDAKMELERGHQPRSIHGATPMPDQQPKPSRPKLGRLQCTRSPTGWHQLVPEAQVGARDDRRFPCGTEIHLRCRYCKTAGRAVLEDNQIVWDDPERLPE